MSKLCDVKGMYGQDLGITVTNAPSNIIEENNVSGQLPKNMIIISSENDDNNNDIGMPAMFATDYNGNPLRLTYAIHTINGLSPNENGELELHVDGKSIKEVNGNLTVDTNNLTYCSFNNLGVTKIAKTITSRNNSAYPIDTFISVDKNGVLYLSDSFISHIYQYVATKIANNIYPIIMDNIRGWLIDTDKTSKNYYYPSDRISVIPFNEDGIIVIRHFILYYKSASGISEEIEFDINNNEYPIKEVILNSKTTSVVEDEQSTPEIKLYRHSMDFTIKFYPNYNLQNNIFLNNQYFIKIHPQAFESNKYLMFYFNQNNAFNQSTNNIDWPFVISSQEISLNALNLNKEIQFNFNNKYKYFEDAEFILEIYYIKSGNENNTDDAIKIVDENINNKLDQTKIRIDFSNENNENDLYNQLKGYLFTTERIGNNIIINKLGDSSNLYKYILRYTINGERSYTYENIFHVNYTFTNLYQAENYMNINSISIFTPTNVDDPYNNFNIVSANNESQKSRLIDNSDEPGIDSLSLCVKYNKNHIVIELGSYSLSKILHNLFRISNDGNKQDIAILIFDTNFNGKIFIDNGGESNDQYEYSIYDLLESNLIEDAIYHKHDEKPAIPYTYEYNYIYPSADEVKNNPTSLTILTAINIDDLMFQSSNGRIHSSNSNKIYYQFDVNNYHGPLISVDMIIDYAKFFKDNIKIFNVNYGVCEQPKFNQNTIWDNIVNNPFHPGTSNSINDIIMRYDENNKINYKNTIFFIAISEELYNIMNMSSIKMSCDFTINNNNSVETITINATKLTHSVDTRLNNDDMIEYTIDGVTKKYYIYEMEYSQIAYDLINDNTDFIYNPHLVSDGFNKILTIQYCWNYVNNNNSETISTNIFKYELPFDLSKDLQHPNIVTQTNQ